MHQMQAELTILLVSTILKWLDFLNFDRFFTLLTDMMTSYKFSSSRIFNCNESGIQQSPAKLPKVVTSKGAKRVPHVSSAEIGCNVTVRQLLCPSSFPGSTSALSRSLIVLQTARELLRVLLNDTDRFIQYWTLLRARSTEQDRSKFVCILRFFNDEVTYK
jgi:hypothetical protein